jgi:hypothetical protein
MLNLTLMLPQKVEGLLLQIEAKEMVLENVDLAEGLSPTFESDRLVDIS